MDIKALFDSERISIHQERKENIELILIDLPEKRLQLLMTNGLSDHNMPVHEKYKGRENTELFFCLPSYWEVNSEDERYTWPAEWLNKLAAHVIEKNAWFGPGHSVDCLFQAEGLSPSMKQDHLLMSDPILVKDELAPITEKSGIHFLAVFPIFGDEMDYKQAKGTYKLMKKLKNKGHTEKLDDFRVTVLKSRFNLF